MKLLRLAGLVVLALNVMIVSIPRCEMVFTVLQHQLTEKASCHESAAHHSDESAASLTNDRFCECSLLKFMAFRIPSLEIHSHMAFRVQTERLLTFDWEAAVADFLPRIEPPYPKV